MKMNYPNENKTKTEIWLQVILYLFMTIYFIYMILCPKGFKIYYNEAHKQYSVDVNYLPLYLRW